ncbi:hypothetical protein FACS1894105_13850 [Clostridia bacterium]|nr:hypothetical protein FACS1894105_13850 [Clostridia bacterium]
MVDGQRKPCIRCRPQNESEEEYRKRLADYMRSIPDEIKTKQDEYERRLIICRDCDELMNGTCRLCGCYVEMRAAKEAQYCPDNKWRSVSW